MSDPLRPADTRSPLTQGGAAPEPARAREGSPLLTGVLTGLLLAALWTLLVYFVHRPVSLTG
ncbi:MAG TPA: hypothetical protein VM736_12925, partial [Gemmatimonadales bacterium]|nr:hypothetical protein [Gemmatimonadales bacterium]